MSVLIPHDRTTRALLVLCSLLALVILIQLLNSGPTMNTLDEGSAETHIELPTSTGLALAPKPLDDYFALLDRPLFFVGRRMPPEPEASAAPPLPRSPLRLKLEGVAISGDSRVALLRNTLNNELLQLTEGASHDGWTLQELSTVSATFLRGDEITEIVLEARQDNRLRR